MIYIIHAEGTAYYKIGQSARSVKERMGVLQTGCPHNLNLILEVEGDVRHERFIHNKLADFRHRGEWFLLDGNGLSLAFTAALATQRSQWKTTVMECNGAKRHGFYYRISQISSPAIGVKKTFERGPFATREMALIQMGGHLTALKEQAELRIMSAALNRLPEKFPLDSQGLLT